MIRVRYIHGRDRDRNLMEIDMIAYFFKTRTGFELRICARPCNGEEFQNAEVIKISGKREANAICKARSITAWNF